MTPAFNQFVYCRTQNPLTGGEGVRPAASSLPLEELTYWDGLLYALASDEHPYDSLCYRVFEESGQAALLYRTSERSTRQQAFVHVVIGPRDMLTPRRALGSLDWDWKGAIKRRAGLKERALPRGGLPRVAGEDLKSFCEVADKGFHALARLDGRPPELDHLIVKIRDQGGPDGGPLQPGDPDLASLGGQKFVAQIRRDPRLAAQILARLITALDSNGALTRNLVGTGFSTHENQYRGGLPTLPRWVFATEDDPGSYGMDRLLIDLRSIHGTSSRAEYKDDANTFIIQFRGLMPGSAPEVTEPHADAHEGACVVKEDEPAEESSTATVSFSAAATVPGTQRPAEQDPSQLSGLGVGLRPSGEGDPLADAQPGHDTVPPDIRGDIFAELTDARLISKLADIAHANEILVLTHEFRRRATPGYKIEMRKRDRPVDILKARSVLAKHGFYAKQIDEFITERALVTGLYRAICDFAVSDHRQGDAPWQVVEEMIGPLANMYVHRSSTRNGVFSPLPAAIRDALWPPMDGSPEGRVPDHLVPEVERLLGHRLMDELWDQAEDPPKQDKTAAAPSTGPQRFLSDRADWLLLLAFVLVSVIIFTCAGYWL